MTTVEKAMEEVEAILKKHGISTHIMVMKDPDSDTESTLYNGSYAWIAGHAAFLLNLMQVRYNTDRYHKEEKPPWA